MTDFEYQKENIIPLPQGRSAAVLSALYAKDSVINRNHETNSPNDTHSSDKESDSLTGKEIREIRRKEFENELKNIEEVDDPLNTYFVYILWLQDNYPSGNDTETGLLSLLETVLKKYQGDPRYLNDSRYLRLWFLYAHYSQEPIEIFKFLSINDIGQNLSTYYEEYALFMETQNKYKEANEIYTLGINRKAQPIERLKKRYIEFQKRMILSVNKPADEIDSPKQDKVRSNFLNMKSKSQTKRIPLQVKHVSSTATQFADQNRNPNIGQGNNNNNSNNASNTSFIIFEDKDNPDIDIKDELFGGQQDQQHPKEIFTSDSPQKLTRQGSLVLPSTEFTNEWTELGSHQLRRKENVKELESWNNVTLPQKASLITNHLSHGHRQAPVSFKVYEDPIEPEPKSDSEHTKTRPEMKTPTKTDNTPNITNKPLSNGGIINSNERHNSVEVHRCLMNMIYALSVNNLYKEIIKEKERVLIRKRAGLRSERMSETLKKLDEKTFNKIKKNIDWSYDPEKSEYYNNFECRNVSEFSIEEIRAKYYEKGRTKKKSREDEEEEEEKENDKGQGNDNKNSSSSNLKQHQQQRQQQQQQQQQHLHHHHSNLSPPSSNSSNSSQPTSSVTNLPPHKKNKILTQTYHRHHDYLSYSINDAMDIQTSNLTSYSASLSSHTHTPLSDEMKGIVDNYKGDILQDEEEEEKDDTRYTVKQDLRIFIPHDLSSEKLSPQSIPRTCLNASIINKQHIDSNKTKNTSSLSTRHPPSSSSIFTSATPSSSSPSTLPTDPSLLNEPHTPTSQTFHRFTTLSSTPLANSNSNLSMNTTDSDNPTTTTIDLDPFSRHESFHSKNSPTVTINTRNACAAIYEWFNEPCDVETMDNLYIDHTLSNSDIDNTFFLKNRQHRQDKSSS